MTLIKWYIQIKIHRTTNTKPLLKCILVVSTNGPLPPPDMEYILSYLTDRLMVEAGHRVIVVCPFPWLPNCFLLSKALSAQHRA